MSSGLFDLRLLTLAGLAAGFWILVGGIAAVSLVMKPPDILQ